MMAVAILSKVAEFKDGRFMWQNAVSDFAEIRASRTLSRPFAMRYLSREVRMRSIFRSALGDQPSVTLALIPSAPSRNRTARTERPSRCAILQTGSYPARFNNLSSSAGVHSVPVERPMGPDVDDFFVPPGCRFSRAAS
jgi:hypothetical protein